jgi:hypothetical protein
MTTDWRDQLEDGQRKEVAFAELYARDFNHGTTGHIAYLLIARMAHLLDVATGLKELPPESDEEEQEAEDDLL